MAEASAPTIRVVGVVMRDEAGRILTVRKRGTARFMLPGGKPEPGETALDTAVRECAEELDATLDASALTLLGRFESAAANEPGHRLESTVLLHPLVSHGEPAAEIEELRWLDPASPLPEDLAPLLQHHVLPALSTGRRHTEN